LLWDLVRYRALVQNLVFKDLTLKYRDSALGLVWSLLNPLLILTVYTVVFRYVLRVPMEHYGYFLVTGLLPWNFFAGSALAASRAIIDNANLIKKVAFPREALPVAAVLFNFCQLLLALAVFVPALGLASGVPLRWTAALLLPLLGLHLLFTLGLAFVLATATVFFRDVAHLVEVGLVPLFWMTPIIYPVAMAPAGLQWLFTVSPLAAFARAYQDVLFWGRLPESAALVGVLAWPLLALAAGHAIFRRHRAQFAQEV
jgi:ABC-type polysaccharide/polyol phosphate export permease